MQKNLALGFIAIICMLISSCHEDIDIFSNSKTDHNYYPARVGTEWYYEVDSLIFRKTIDGLKIDTIKTYVKEVIVDTLKDVEFKFYIIRKFERPDISLPWEIKSVYSLVIDREDVHRTEENQSFIKFNFPVQENKEWDANLYLDKEQEIEVGGETIEVFKNWQSKYTNKDKMYHNGFMQFDSTMLIQLADYESLIEIRKGHEIYARNYGLVYRYLKVLDTQCNGKPNDCKDIPWEEKADKGFIVTQKLTGFKW